MDTGTNPAMTVGLRAGMVLKPQVSTDGQTAEAGAKRGFSPSELPKGFPVYQQAGVLPKGAVPATSG